MAKLGQRFDATVHDTEQRSEFEELPTGIYRFEIEASEIMDTAKGGVGLKYTANVLEPSEVAGRKYFGFINLENPNPQAQEIGQRELASLCRACGLDGVDDSEELHFIGYTVKLGMGKDSKEKNADGTPKYPARAEVKRYFFPDEGDLPEIALDAVQPTRAPSAPANDNRPAANDNRAATAQPKSAGAKPWAKRAA